MVDKTDQRSFLMFARMVALTALFSLPTLALADTQVVRGSCDSTSETWIALPDQEAVKQAVECSVAVISTMPNQDGHQVIVQFLQAGAGNPKAIVSFTGPRETDGELMTVARLYLGRAPFTVDTGVCKFFYEDLAVSGIFCEARIDRARSVSAVVTFNAGR